MVAKARSGNGGGTIASLSTHTPVPGVGTVDVSPAQESVPSLQGKGQNREAEQELVAALDAVPTYAEATLELASLRRRLGRTGEALTLLIELLQRDPYHFDALIGLGETLLALGRKRDAVHAFPRGLRFDPTHVGRCSTRRHPSRTAQAMTRSSGGRR